MDFTQVFLVVISPKASSTTSSTFSIETMKEKKILNIDFITAFLTAYVFCTITFDKTLYTYSNEETIP